MAGVGTWLVETEKAIVALLSPEEKLLIEFFGPLFDQVKDQALKLGLDDLQLGLGILKEAALAAATAAEGAAPGVDKVKAAEDAFIASGKVGISEASNTVTASATALYQTTLNNAEAAAIKAAVAIIQTATVNAVTVPANTAPVVNK